MPDYQQGKIYKIVCNETGLTYYGSTVKPRLSERMSNHRGMFKAYKEDPISNKYVSSFQVLERNNYEYSLVESYPCNTKDELHARERYYIENNECVNRSIPSRTKAEYRDDHKPEIAEYNKLYYEANRHTLLEKAKHIDETKRERIKTYMKGWRKPNEQNIAKYNEETNIHRNAKRRERRSKQEAEMCECGGRYLHENKARHLKSDMHQLFLQTQQA
jgi:hypothetical protein